VESAEVATMTFSLLVSVAIFSFVTSVSPGPNNTFLLSSGANFGLKKSLPYLNGIMVGLTGMMVALGAGLGVVFTTLPVVYQILKWVGFAYIVYLATLIVRSTSKSDTGEAQYIGFVKATTFQFVNPKAWVVVGSFMATMVPVDAGLGATIFVCLLFLVFTYPGAFLWAVAGQVLKEWLSNPLRRRIFNIVSAVLLVLSMVPVLFMK
jgi:threonine/homoserine/homoserine lactone efflux protein